MVVAVICILFITVTIVVPLIAMAVVAIGKALGFNRHALPSPPPLPPPPPAPKGEVAYLAIRDGCSLFPLAIGLTRDAAMKSILDYLTHFDVANPTLRQYKENYVYRRYSTENSYTEFRVVEVKYIRDSSIDETRSLPSVISDLSEKISTLFLVQPCFRCHEFLMRLVDISPNGRSIKYTCAHCSKKLHSAAATPESFQVLALLEESKRMGGRACDVTFNAPAAPLPYEQTSRTPIPEAVRSEVWRRDGGRCVKCDSNANLEFDHIIPVVLGGGTSVANLQLLCQACNGSKGKKI